jgi:hypothetical protein
VTPPGSFTHAPDIRHTRSRLRRRSILPLTLTAWLAVIVVPSNGPSGWTPPQERKPSEATPAQLDRAAAALRTMGATTVDPQPDRASEHDPFNYHAEVTAWADAGDFTVNAENHRGETGWRAVVRAQLTARHGGRDYFRVRHTDGGRGFDVGINASPVSLLTDPAPIRRDIQFTNDLPPGYWPFTRVPEALLPHHAAIYFHTRQALELADLLSIPYDYAAPMRVFTYASPKQEAHWSGHVTGGPSDPSPQIVFGSPTSDYGDPGRPDNREWHEFSHHLTAEALGNAMPHFPERVNHAGYYVNPGSTDAWTEGVAEFLSTMVAKHVAGDGWAHLYHMQYPGYYRDLEFDYRAWSPPDTGEESALAGVLLDLEDGSADYAARIPSGLTIVRHGIVEADGQRALVGTVHNGGIEDALSVAVYAAFYDAPGQVVHQMRAMSWPRDLVGTRPLGRLREPFPGESGTFAMSLEGVPAFDRYAVAVRDLVGGGSGTDDDHVQIPLQNLWQAIVTWRSTERRYGNYFTFDVKDVYDAVKTTWGGKDADRNGVEDIDEIFIAHGFFADLNGDRVWQPGETPGPRRGRNSAAVRSSGSARRRSGCADESPVSPAR